MALTSLSVPFWIGAKYDPKTSQGISLKTSPFQKAQYN